MKTLPASSRLAALVLVLLSFVLCVSVTPSTAIAQNNPPKKEEPLKPPQPSLPDNPPTVWNILVLALVVGLVGGAALIPSKRGHQD